MLQLLNWASIRLSSDHQLMFRFIKLLMFISVLTSFILLFYFDKLSFMDLIISCLAFIPTGWGLLLVSTTTLIIFSTSTLVCVRVQATTILFMNRIIISFVHFFIFVLAYYDHLNCSWSQISEMLRLWIYFYGNIKIQVCVIQTIWNHPHV
jgi:hypothetical protein